MNGDAANIGAAAFYLSGVQPSPDVEPESSPSFANGQRRLDRPGGSVEGREEAVPGRLYLFACEASELPANHGVVCVEELSPRSVPRTSSHGGRVDDVGEEDRRQDPVVGGLDALPGQELLDLTNQRFGILLPRVVVGAFQLHQSRPEILVAA